MTKFQHNILCPYCGCEMSYRLQDADSPRYATRDHIVAKSRGGDNRQCVRVCSACNADKASLSLNEWRAALSVRRRHIHVFYFERQIPTILLGIVTLAAWSWCATFHKML